MQENIRKYSTFIKSLLIKLLYIVIIPIILYDVILIIQSIAKPDSIPSVFGIKTFTIVSRSMEPTLEINDVVFIKKYDINKLQEGDIIAFIQDEDIITHRIERIEINKNEKLFITKGDSNNTTDPKRINEFQIEGKYIGKIPKIGKIFSLLKNKYVFVVVIVILIICYILERKKLNKKIERKKKREKYDKKNKTDT